MTNDTPAFDGAGTVPAVRPLPPERNPIFFGLDGLRAGWSLLIYVALIAAFFSTAHSVTHRLHLSGPGPSSSEQHEASPRFSLVNEGVPFLAVALATWVMSRLERREVGTYGLGDSRIVARFLAGLGWGVAFLSLLVLALRGAGLLVFDSRLLSRVDVLRYGAVWGALFLLVALFEEYFLRGYVQFTLSRGLAGVFGALGLKSKTALGFWTAAFLLSFIFGLGHGSNPGESPIGLLSAGIAGLVFCLSLWRTGSLWWAIGFHASWDWAQSFLYGVADSGTMVQFHLFATHAVGKPLLSGGATGPEGSIYILPVMAAAGVTIILTLPRSTEATPETVQPNPVR